jgi:hypothetical protein
MAACDSCTQQFPTLTKGVLLQRKELALTPVNSVYSIQTLNYQSYLHHGWKMEESPSHYPYATP